MCVYGVHARAHKDECMCLFVPKIRLFSLNLFGSQCVCVRIRCVFHVRKNFPTSSYMFSNFLFISYTFYFGCLCLMIRLNETHRFCELLDSAYTQGESGRWKENGR